MLGESSSNRVKTCENCVRAKIRCSQEPGSLICERCHRLKKECFFRQARPRAPHKKRTTRIQALEGKIDQIMGQINLATPRTDPSPSQTPTSGPSNDGYSTESLDVIGKGLLSYERANELLEQYREAMLLFPFVMLPQTTTVEDLQAEKPFLLLCILVFASFQDKALQEALEAVVKAYVGDVVIHADPSSQAPPLETLQGLLVILAGTRQLYQICRFSNYTHLAISIVNDVRFDRPPKYRVASRLDVQGDSDQTEDGTGADERRALIGLFLLNSTNSIIRQKTPTFPWTSFIESCAADLSQKCEYPTDQYMIYYVQLQHMLERMNTLATASIEGHPDIEGHIHSFRIEVENYKNRLSIPPSSDVLIANQYHALVLQLYQISLLDTKANPTPPNDDLLSSRSDALCHSLSAAKRFIYYYSTLPPMLEKSYSLINWLNLGFLATASCKLVIAALDPNLRMNTQVQQLRDALDMPLALRFFAGRLQEVAKTCKADSEEFCYYQKWLVAAGIWFEKTYQFARMDASKMTDDGVDFASFEGQFTGQNMEGVGEHSDPSSFGLDLDVSFDELMGGWVGPFDELMSGLAGPFATPSKFG